MSVDSTEFGFGSEAERSSVLARLVLRLKSLETRFPSMSQSLLSILDQAIVSGTSFVSAVIIGRMTTPDEIGLYYLVLSITIVAAAVQDSAVWAPFLVYSKRRHGRELEEYSASVWIQLLLLTAFCVALLPAIILVLSATNHTAVMPGLVDFVHGGTADLVAAGRPPVRVCKSASANGDRARRGRRGRAARRDVAARILGPPDAREHFCRDGWCVWAGLHRDLPARSAAREV